MKTLIAKKLIVTAQEIGDCNPKYSTYQFPVWEFSNGAILVPGETTNDWFFDGRNEIEPNGTAIVAEIEETDETNEFDVEDLKTTIKSSESEFECEAGKIKELI
jgi:hypothetical protein